MIRNAVVHILNEQPLVVDLFEAPTPTDVGLLCTNVRTLAGKRPVFIDRIDSTFYFPYDQIRFVEIVPTGDGPGALLPEPAAAAAPEPEADLEIDEEFLRRVRDL